MLKKTMEATKGKYLNGKYLNGKYLIKIFIIGNIRKISLDNFIKIIFS